MTIDTTDAVTADVADAATVVRLLQRHTHADY